MLEYPTDTYQDILQWPGQWRWELRLMPHICAGRFAPEKELVPRDSWQHQRGRYRGSRSLQTRCSTASLKETYPVTVCSCVEWGYGRCRQQLQRNYKSEHYYVNVTSLHAVFRIIDFVCQQFLAFKLKVSR